GGFTVAKTGKRRDRDRRSMECATAKTTSDRSNSKNLCPRGARFFENERNRATESENREHPSRRFGRGWRRRSVNQRDKLFQQRRSHADEIAGWELFDGALTASRCGKSG